MKFFNKGFQDFSESKVPGYLINRSLATLAYLYPLFELTQLLGQPILKRMFIFRDIYWSFLHGLFQASEQQPVWTIGIFFVLYIGCVRQERLSQFVRYSACQALLIYMLVSFLFYSLGILPAFLVNSIIGALIKNLVYFGLSGLIFYCIIDVLKGKCAVIPFVSEAVRLQIRKL